MKISFYKKVIVQLVAATILTTMCIAQTKKQVKEFLGIGGPVIFNSQSYMLSWSSHPTANFYKQEYLTKGANADKYKTMLLVDVVTESQDIKAVVAAKKQELENMKASNPLVNYELIHNPASGEYLLDFLLSANAPDGSLSIVEHNVYRYALFTTKSGIKGIQLFGISSRAYGNEADAFLVKLKTTRKGLINQVAKFSLPGIAIQ